MERFVIFKDGNKAKVASIGRFSGRYKLLTPQAVEIDIREYDTDCGLSFDDWVKNTVQYTE
jgi:hypothetical protein